MASAKRPVFYTGGGVINSGPRRRELLREFVRHDRHPCTTTLMGLGAFPASDPQFLGMLGHARHLRSQSGDAWLRRDAEHRRALRRPRDRPAQRLLARTRKKIHVDIDPSSINKNVRVDIADRRRCAHVLAAMIERLEGRSAPQDREALKRLVGADRGLARDATACATPGRRCIIKPQHAMERLYELTQERDARPTSPPRSASTRCGRRSTSASSSRTAG